MPSTHTGGSFERANHLPLVWHNNIVANAELPSPTDNGWLADMEP